MRRLVSVALPRPPPGVPVLGQIVAPATPRASLRLPCFPAEVLLLASCRCRWTAQPRNPRQPGTPGKSWTGLGTPSRSAMSGRGRDRYQRTPKLGPSPRPRDTIRAWKAACSGRSGLVLLASRKNPAVWTGRGGPVGIGETSMEGVAPPLPHPLVLTSREDVHAPWSFGFLGGKRDLVFQDVCDYSFHGKRSGRVRD